MNQAKQSMDVPMIRKKRIIAIVSILIMIALFAVIGIYVGKPLVETANQPDQFREMVQERGFFGKLIMIGVTMLQVIVAIIPGEPFEIVAGYAFGIFEGTLLCLIGAAAASALILLVVKKFGRKVIELFFDTEKIDSWAFMKDSKRLDFLVFMLFLIPGTPKDILVYVTGLTDMKITTFLLLTSAARIPSVISSTIFGSMMNQKQYVIGAIVYGITAVITVVSVLFYRKHEKKLKQEAQANEKE